MTGPRDRAAEAQAVTASTFPDQADEWLHRRVAVCFDYDTSAVLGGTIVRCDAVEPGVMIIRLDDGRHVLSVECQYTFNDRYVDPASVGPAGSPP